MFDKFSAIRGGRDFFGLLGEPFIVIHQAFDSFHYEGPAVASLLR